MKTFKTYFNEALIWAAKPLYDAIDDVNHGKEISQMDIIHIKQEASVNAPYFKPLMYQLLISLIKYEKRIPEVFIPYINLNTKLKDSFVFKIRNDYKDQIPDILKRNPELMEHFI